MKRLFSMAIVAITLAVSAHAQDNKMVGGAAMYSTKNIVENAGNSKDHTTLVAAVKAANLVDVLESDGPFTVFAPTNEAFNKLPKGAVDNLLKPENQTQLQGVLKYHVVPGKISSMDLTQMIKDSGGKATLKTVEGDNLYTSLDKQGKIWIWDENGGKAMVTISDVNQSNGVIHVIDHVLMPKM
jgi:uncharacterized surface protein with fasciclin (FAS1) repeats